MFKLFRDHCLAMSRDPEKLIPKKQNNSKSGKHFIGIANLVCNANQLDSIFFATMISTVAMKNIA